MGRIQSSIGLVTGTDIAGTVDQLISISARPRDRLLASIEELNAQRQGISELTALVIGVQLSGSRLAETSLFRSRKSESSNSDAVSVSAGKNAEPGTHKIRTLQVAATHSVQSAQRFDENDSALGFTGSLSIRPEGFVDDSVSLSGLNNGRGVEAGTIRITDRSGASAEIDLSSARTISDVLSAINDADVDVSATTSGGAIKLVDLSGSTTSNLRVEQIGDAETAADLGLWGIDVASDTATGFDLDLPEGSTALQGVALSELAGGAGIEPLTDLDITLSDGSSQSIDLSAAETTTEIIDAINASGLSVIARLNDAGNGFQIRDVSGGEGNLVISSADDTAAKLGVAADTSNDIVVGEDLQRQTVTSDTLLADLNHGLGIDSGSFTITDSAGAVGAINLTVSGITTVGELVDAINDQGIGVTASVNEDGDGISIVDTAGGSSTLTIEDTGSGTAAADLGIAGTATDQTIGGSTVSALVGTQAATIEIEATDSLSDIVAKINADGRYGEATAVANDDGTFSPASTQQ